MNYIRPFVSTGGGTAAGTALAPLSENRRPATPPARVTPKPSESPKAGSGYGLPCAKCRKYYPANLAACPVCNSAERVSPSALIPSAPPAEATATPKVLDQERERVLREFKAQLYAAHTQVPTVPQASCAHANGHGKHDAATICNTCYARLQERVDVLEAALLMDLKEAAQVIYDAVWADTSDCNKTYHNAAQALLTEVRRRAGMKLVVNQVRALTH
jgi:hypothetical protein